MSFINDLLEKPANLSTASKYAVINGFIYLGAGALLIVWPGAVQTLLRDPAFVGHEGALFRVIGMAVAIIGWLYVFGGRSGARQIRPSFRARPSGACSFGARAPCDRRRFSSYAGGVCNSLPLAWHRCLGTPQSRDVMQQTAYCTCDEKLQDGQMLTTSIGWVLIVSGIITAGGGLVALLFPHFNLRSTYGNETPPVSQCSLSGIGEF